MSKEKVMPTVEESGRALADTLDVLSSLNIPCILDGGTLLGFYRDDTFAEDDHDDIDLTTDAIYWNRHEEIHRAMLERGFELYHKWDRDEVERHSGQYAWKRDNAKIDLMFKERKGQRVWWTVYGGKRGITYKSVPAELCLVATRLSHVIQPPGIAYGMIAGIPRKVEEYLAYRYGDWEQPVHRSEYSCYTTDRCIIEPNTYEAI